LQVAGELVEGVGHAGLDGAFGDLQDIGDFAELEVFEVTEDDDGAVGIGEAAEGVFDEERVVLAGGGLVGVWVGRGGLPRSGFGGVD